MLPYFEEVAAASLATTEEAMEYVKKIHDGVGSLELYTGKDVEVVNIVKGESAPSHLPLQVVQAKLMVDEELAVWCDLDSWFDFSDMEKFHETLRTSPGLVEQIFRPNVPSYVWPQHDVISITAIPGKIMSAMTGTGLYSFWSGTVKIFIRFTLR